MVPTADCPYGLWTAPAVANDGFGSWLIEECIQLETPRSSAAINFTGTVTFVSLTSTDSLTAVISGIQAIATSDSGHLQRSTGTIVSGTGPFFAGVIGGTVTGSGMTGGPAGGGLEFYAQAFYTVPVPTH
ncbi:MAG TPA: hypothetical protein VH541_11095 [Gaiellaceae bacterium]|jgi:hypothetical protein